MSNIKNYIDNHDMFTTTTTTASGGLGELTGITGTTITLPTDITADAWNNTVASIPWMNYNDMKDIEINIEDDEDYIIERVGKTLKVKIVNAKEKHKQEFDSKMTEYIDE